MSRSQHASSFLATAARTTLNGRTRTPLPALLLCLLTLLALASGAAQAQVVQILNAGPGGPAGFPAGASVSIDMPTGLTPAGGPAVFQMGSVAGFQASNPNGQALPGEGGFAIDYGAIPARMYASDGENLVVEDHPLYVDSNAILCGVPTGPTGTAQLINILPANTQLTLPIQGLAFGAPAGPGPTLWMIDFQGWVEAYTVTVSVAGAITLNQQAAFASGIPGVGGPVGPDEIPTGMGWDSNTGSLWVSTLDVNNASRIVNVVAGGIINANTINVTPGVQALGLTVNNSVLPGAPAQCGETPGFNVVYFDGQNLVDAQNQGNTVATGLAGPLNQYGLAFAPDPQVASGVVVGTSAIPIASNLVGPLNAAPGPQPVFLLPSQVGMAAGFTPLSLVSSTGCPLAASVPLPTPPVLAGYQSNLISLPNLNLANQAAAPICNIFALPVQAAGNLLTLQAAYYDFAAAGYRVGSTLHAVAALP